MSERIPMNFEEAWPQSDVVLMVPDGDVIKSVHVNKKFLSVFSPYFDKLFNGDFKEKNEKKIPLEVAYEPLIHALRLLHHIDYNQPPLSVNTLVDTYRIGDQLDIPKIRQYCHDTSRKMSKVDWFLFQEALGIAQERKIVFENMTLAEREEYMKKCPYNTTFTLEEVNIYKKEAAKKDTFDYFMPVYDNRCFTCYSYLKKRPSGSLCVSCCETSIPYKFEVNWKHSDVALICGYEDDKLLYVNEEILSIFCKLPNPKILDKQKCMFIKGDYISVEEALSVLHSERHPMPELHSESPEYIAKLMKGLKALNTQSFEKECLARIGQFNNVEKMKYYTRMEMVDEQLQLIRAMTDREIAKITYSLTSMMPIPAYLLRRYPVICRSCGNFTVWNTINLQYHCSSCNLWITPSK